MPVNKYAVPVITLLLKSWIPIFLLGILSCKKNVANERPGTDTIVPAEKSLFQKYEHNPLFDIGTNVPVWRNIHAANVSILGPDETRGGNWRLFMRGSGNNRDGYHDNIGSLLQSAATFDPYGPWDEQVGNPNLEHGGAGTYDAQHALDAAAVSGPGKQVILYYMSRDGANRSGLCVATSEDGGIHFTKFFNNPLKKDVGPNDAVFYNNLYYIFYGDGKWNGNGFDEPLQIWLSLSSSGVKMSEAPAYALKVGGYRSFDSYSVNGAKIFKVSGDDRWFMLYQCSTKHFDYPERFHCAYSFDLKSWTKVKNTKPLLTRGKPGEFDQGAIWTGAVIEDKGELYVYYEGWGSFSSDVGIRDNPYYAGGNSRVGIARCSTVNFLNWVDE